MLVIRYPSPQGRSRWPVRQDRPAHATSEDEDKRRRHAPAVQLLDDILLDAIQRRASDVHFERGPHQVRIRLRIDGVLHAYPSPPTHLQDALAARIKALAGLDIAERRLPQDGRLSLRPATSSRSDTVSSEVHFRVSTLPTVHGEKIVLRLLDSLPAMLDLPSLGYDAVQDAAIQCALRSPHGLILTTGPTGSGKTLSLFSFLHLLNAPGINICTIEDPVELTLPGLNQVNVREKAGLGFAGVLRAFLRQDPDVLMVGEIRDRETADIAISAAQTGHRVLSTLHTNDAPSAIARLRDIGVAPYKIASALQLVCAQRLLRRLCTHCSALDACARAPYLGARRAVGCDQCHGIGYTGRIGIHQVMPLSDRLRAMIVDQASIEDLSAQSLAQGVGTLSDAADAAVRAGLTSLDEAHAAGGVHHD